MYSFSQLDGLLNAPAGTVEGWSLMPEFPIAEPGSADVDAVIEWAFSAGVMNESGVVQAGQIAGLVEVESDAQAAAVPGSVPVGPQVVWVNVPVPVVVGSERKLRGGQQSFYLKGDDGDLRRAWGAIYEGCEVSGVLVKGEPVDKWSHVYRYIAAQVHTAISGGESENG